MEIPRLSTYSIEEMEEKCDVCCVWKLLGHSLADRVVGDHPLLVNLALAKELLHLLHREPLPQRGEDFSQFSRGNTTRAVSIKNSKSEIIKFARIKIKMFLQPTGMPQEYHPRFQHNPFVSASC